MSNPSNRERGLTVADKRRFWDKVNPRLDGCWPWRGKVKSGYGYFSMSGIWISAHRIAYHLLRDPIPEGLTLDHLCRVRHCVNPFHLEPVTLGVNVLRGINPWAENAKKTHCKRGHPLSGANLRIFNRARGRARTCVTCQRMHDRAYRHKENL